MSEDAAHLDLDALADLAEGLLDGPAEARARRHLAGCPRCAADQAALAGVPALLAAAAVDRPVPQDVARRLDTALAAAASEPAGTAVTRTVTPLRATGRSGPRGMRLLQAAAVVVLLLAGGAIGVSALHDGGNGAGSGSATSDRAGGVSGPEAAQGGFPVTASGRDWTKQSVTAAVPQLLAGSLGGVPTAGASAGDGAGRPLASAPAGRLAGGPALADCLTALVDGPATPLAVDLATFAGKPAAVILLPGLGDAARVDVWVVGAGCAQNADDLLYYASVPRP